MRRMQESMLWCYGSLFLILHPSFAQIATSVHISVTDPRPLAEAAKQLEQQVKIAINYEDIPYAFSGDIVDNTAAVLQTRTPEQRAAANSNIRFLVPRGGPLTWDSALPLVAVSDVLQVLTGLAALSTSDGYPGVYSASFVNGAFFITPTQMRNASGTLSPVVPVLDTQVTLPTEERTVGDAVGAVLAQVSQKAGIKVAFGMAPANLLLGTKTTIGATSEPARSVIGRLFAMLAPGKAPDGSAISLLSYRLLFDPKLRYYAMNIHPIQKTPQQRTGPVQKKPTSAGPYMKKQ